MRSYMKLCLQKNLYKKEKLSENSITPITLHIVLQQ